MSKTIGIGFIGTGFARRVQMPAFASVEGTRLASVASGSLENARSAAREFSIPHFTDDWRETISRDDVDLVCITTPPNLHRELTLFALACGKHVLCEKPMAMNVAEAAEMATAARASDRLCLIDHELRFQPGRIEAREMLRHGEIGEVRHVKALFQAPHRGRTDTTWNWWSDASQGGGALGAIGSHIIDSFHWFLNAEIASVSCQLQTQVKHRPDANREMQEVTSDDEANILLRFAPGELAPDSTGLVSISMTEAPTYRNRLEFYGTLGSMRVDHRGELYTAGNGDENWSQIEVDMGTGIDGLADTGFSRAFMAFAPLIVAAIGEGTNWVDGAATFDDGVQVQRVLDAARESNEKAAAVTIP